jgi:hypothetical protein
MGWTRKHREGEKLLYLEKESYFLIRLKMLMDIF